MPTINIKDIPESKIVKLVDLSEDSINKIAEAVAQKIVEPVKHGHWDNMGDFEQCSVCHGTHLKEIQTYYGKATWVKMSYCPHCGAKMDGVEE